jgi:quinol monooxygenase YgiN
MAITVLLEIRTQPDKADDMVQWMHDNLPDTRARQGAGKMELIVDQDDPTHMVVYEIWDSKADQEAYVAWRAERGDIEVLGGMLVAPPSSAFFDIVDPG